MSRNQPQAPAGQVFTGPASQMRESPWLASEDIASLGGAKDLVIKQVWSRMGVQFAGGRTKDGFSVEFEGVKRQLFLNATNRKTLARLFGLNTSEWSGQRVCLFVADNTGKIGERKCIRLRAASPPPKPANDSRDSD